MMPLVRTSWAARLGGLAVLFGLLAQAVLGVPAALAMAQAVPICGVAHDGGTTDTPDRPAHDHAHCLLCQANAGPPLLASATQLRPPSGYAFVAANPATGRWFAAAVTTGFQSRAPPTLA